MCGSPDAACDFCQAPDTDRHTISPDDLSRICRWLRSNEVRSIKFSGGEPTVRSDLPDLIALASSHGLKVTVVTNGIVLRETVVKALMAHRAELKFSIHHADERNDLALGRKSFTTVVGNLRRARETGVPCAINTVVSRANRDELRDLAGFAAAQGCHKITFILFVPRGRGLQMRDSLELSIPDLGAIMSEIDMIANTLETVLKVRCIDIRTKPYWIIENDHSLVIESWIETRDRIVLTPDEFRAAVRDEKMRS